MAWLLLALTGFLAAQQQGPTINGFKGIAREEASSCLSCLAFGPNFVLLLLVNGKAAYAGVRWQPALRTISGSGDFLKRPILNLNPEPVKLQHLQPPDSPECHQASAAETGRRSCAGLVRATHQQHSSKELV